MHTHPARPVTGGTGAQPSGAAWSARRRGQVTAPDEEATMALFDPRGTDAEDRFTAWRATGMTT
jgi:hypothetical protein